MAHRVTQSQTIGSHMVMETVSKGDGSKAEPLEKVLSQSWETPTPR